MSSTMTEKLAGCYRGIVLDSNDPQGLHRVKVQVPDLLGLNDLGWAWPAIPNLAGQTPPSEQDPVWVMFEAGDIERPVYIGTWIATRPGGGSLQDNYVLSGGSNVYPSTASEFLGVQVNGDTFDRYTATASGTQYWGPGSAPADVSLGRLSASTLGLTGNLSVTGALSAASLAVPGSISGGAVSASSVAVTGAISAGSLSVSGSINASSLSLSTPLPVSSGGTGSATQNFVDLTTAQNIAGVKTFSVAPVVPANSFPETAVTNLVADLAARAIDSTVVHLAGAETITGAKTFSAVVSLPSMTLQSNGGIIDTSGTQVRFYSATTGVSAWVNFPGGITMNTATSFMAGADMAGGSGVVSFYGNASQSSQLPASRMAVGYDGSRFNIWDNVGGKGIRFYDVVNSIERIRYAVINNGTLYVYGNDHMFGRGVFGAAAGRIHLGDLGTTDAYVQAERGDGVATNLFVRSDNNINFGHNDGTLLGQFTGDGNFHSYYNNTYVAESNAAAHVRLGEIWGNGGIYKPSGSMRFDLGDSAGSFIWSYLGTAQATMDRSGNLLANGSLRGARDVAYTGGQTQASAVVITNDTWYSVTGWQVGFVKKASASALLVRVNMSCWNNSGVAIAMRLGVGYSTSSSFTSPTINYATFYLNQQSVHTEWSQQFRLTGLTTGQYYFRPMLYGVNGTMGQDPNDAYSITVEEIV